MSRAALFAGVALAEVASLSACGPSTEAIEPRPDQAVVRGVLRDQHHAPIRGAKVSPASQSGPDYEVVTDRMGRYQLVIPPGHQRLNFRFQDMDVSYGGRVKYGSLLVDVDIAGGQTKEIHPQMELHDSVMGAKPYGAPPARRRIV